MIALYPGAYKPPHRGHFNVVKSLLDGSYNGAVYNKDNYKETGADLLKGKRDNKPKIDKVIVFVGGGERNGITKEESVSIWNIYAKYLGNVEIIDGQKNPMFAAKDYAQANPKEEFVAVTGIRGEKDFVDLRRVTTFKNAPNVQGLALTSAPGSGVRATDFRNSILSGNLDKITDFFPEELSREEILNILTDLKDKIVAEILASNIEGFVEGYFKETESIEEGIKEPAPIRSIDRSRLSNLYNYLLNLIPTGTTIDLVGDKINIKYKNPIQEQQSGPQLKDYITSLTEYMLELGMNITPLPEVKLRKDEANAANFFGRTAYYDPNAREVVLYITGRHDKDIVRSYAHEMIHHMQNLQGTLHNIQTQDTNEDDKLLELEKEAYTLGNITFRNWEDGLKNNLQENLDSGEVDLVQQFKKEVGAKQCSLYGKRDNCGPAALDFISWAESKGIKGLKRIDGYFKADIPISSKRDFTREMKQEFLNDGGNWDSAKERFDWINSSKYAKQWKYIPHYWVEDTNGKIYDPSGQQQFIDTGYAKDLNSNRYTLSDVVENYHFKL